MNTDYILYFIQTHKEYLKKHKKGSAIPHLNKELLGNLQFPVPPLAEQRRIVDRVERLFAKLDEVKEIAEEMIGSCELRKSAILHKAFAGELTAGWRKRRGLKLESWERRKLSECCKIGSGGTPSRKNPDYYQGAIPWVKTGEIDWNEIWDTEEKITEAAVDSSSAKVYDEGAVLVAMYGMGLTRGRAAILKIRAATNQAVCVLQPKENLRNTFLYYFFMRNYWNLREQSIGGNQLNLSGTIIGEYAISLPSLDEQNEIVSILNAVISKEAQVKEAAEAVLDRTATLKKIILARAFRGELGTNDKTEESSVELLRRML